VEGVIGRILGSIRSLASRRIPVEIRAPDVGPLRLVLTVKAAAVKLRGAPGGGLLVRGERSRRGRVELVVEEGPSGERIARLLVEAASVEVIGPVESLEVKSSTGAVKAGPLGPLKSLIVEASSSSIKASATLAPGARVSVRARTASVGLEISPAEAGEYPLEVEASSSLVKVEAPADYVVEESSAKASSVRVASEKGVRARFRVRISATSSSINLL
jgi:hypothetical protein